MSKLLLLLTFFFICSLCILPPMEASTTAPIEAAKPEQADLEYLKRFFNSADRWGLYRRIRKMKRNDYEKLLVLHEKYDLSTEYLSYTKQLIKKKPKLKVRKRLNRDSYWQTELRSFLIKHQMIEYMPTRGARLDQGGFRFQF